MEYLSNSNHIMQTLKAVNSGYNYFRTGVCSDNVWSWTEWCRAITNADFLTKMVSLNQVTVPANAGITGSTTDISNQIPSGYKLLDARELGSGNNGCYIYYFKVNGTNITLQLRNVTNAAITTSPGAQLLLIPK